MLTRGLGGCKSVAMISPTSANAAIQLATTAGKTLNALRERVSASKDTETRQLVNTMYGQMAALHEAVSRLKQENEELRRKVAQLEKPAGEKPTPKIRQVGEVNYYFVGDDGPYWQPCYDGKLNKLVALSPTRNLHGGVARSCPVCSQTFYEQKIDRRSQVPMRGEFNWG